VVRRAFSFNFLGELVAALLTLFFFKFRLAAAFAEFEWWLTD
jgi:hypothetical protein